MATKFRFIYNGVSSDFDDYYVRTDLFNQEQIWSFGSNNLGQLGNNTITNRSSPVQEISFGVNWKQAQISTFTNAIKTDGTLWSWGPNTYGQLGDNTTTHRSSAVQVLGFSTVWYNVCNGYHHTLAVKNDGTLWSWGRNSYGQLGENTNTHRSSPIQTVSLGQNWAYVSAGYQHSLASKSDSSIWSFGRNNSGQLGTGLLLHRSSPTQTLGYANNWSAVSTGGSHTAGVKADGTLWICGLGTSGQLGDGTIVSKSSPIQVSIFATNWSSAGAGYGSTAAIKTDGTLWTWGNNSYGVLGNYTTTNRSSPVQVVGFATNWNSVSGSRFNMAAIKSDGTLWTWGRNTEGQLGDNTIIHRSSPVQTVAGGNNWSSVACGQYYMAAIKTDGTLWGWGRNNTGQLGDNTVTNRSSPVQTIAFGSNWSSIAAGDNTSAIKTDGTLWAWGNNSYGGIGDNTTVHRSSPVQVVGFATNWSSVSTGSLSRNTAAIKTDGTLWVWGRNNFGQLGDNTVTNKSSPVQTATGGSNWSRVSVGNFHAAAIKTDGTLWVWGYNINSQLGDGTTVHRSSPVQTAAFGTNWSKVFSGYNNTTAIKTNGTFWTWGQNIYGANGDNSTITQTRPVQPVGYQFDTNWANVELGATHSAAIKKDGTLWSWGPNTSGQLGDNSLTNKSIPVQEISYATNWSSLSLGSNFTGAIKTDGTLWMWGANYIGNLGDNTVAFKGSPVQTVAFGSNWSAIACGQSYTAAIKTDGSLWAWGSGTSGELGDNTATSKSSPVQVVGFATNWSKVSAGSSHTGAIKTDGTLWTWGLGTSGQLGDGTIVSKSSPVQVVIYATNWSSINTAAYFSAAIKTDGTLWTWGRNVSGQLGDNTTTDKSSPVQTVTFATNWSKIACGYGHTAAIKTDGTLWTWGLNNLGQLGDNTITHRSSPVQVVGGGTNWSLIAAGYGFVPARTGHTAAIKTDGTLWTWGLNNSGQLGDNTTTHRSSPVQVIGFATNWSKVACGSSYTAAIKTDGTLWTWGSNSFGILGDNTSTNKSSPVQTIAFGSNWSSISCGYTNTAAIKTDGTLWVWGRNHVGQLGDNTIIHRSSPVQTISFGTNWSSVACSAPFVSVSNHMAAVKKDGTLWTWGINSSGQLGNNTTIHRSSPVQTLAFGTTWSSISCNAAATAAIKTDGTLWTWGVVTYGVLGDNTAFTNKSYPIQPLAYSFATNWSNIACGTSNTVATKTDGSIWTWGINTNGSLGNNLTVDYSVPIQTLAYGTNWSQTNLSNFGNAVAAMRTDNTLWTFGTNTNGQLLVDLAAVNLSSPVQILPGSTWLQFSAGKSHSSFVKSDNTLWSSGDNTYGQLGINTSGPGPYVYPIQEATGSTSWKQTSCGDNHTMAVKNDGTLWGWGFNAYGQLGDNTITHRSSPVQTLGFANTWKQVACGSNHSVAIKIDGTVWTWGRGTQGQLGTSAVTHRSSPVQTIAFGSNWWKVAAGYNNTIAIYNYNVTL